MKMQTQQPTPLPNNPDGRSASPRNISKLPKILVVVIILMIYTAGVALASIQLYKKHQSDLAKAVNPHNIVQQALVNNLSLNTVHRKVTYRDNLDRSMLVTWDVRSDFSNFRDPKSMGTVSINFLRDKTNNTQQVEFVAVKGKDRYTNNIYVRMVKGNELSNAPKDWFTFQSSTSWTADSLKDLYQRRTSQNGFTSSTTLPGFDNFKGFNIATYNSPTAYVITANLRDSQEKSKIISELQNDTAYALQNCKHNNTLSWCSGSIITGGLSSINTNLATSEGGSGGLVGQNNNSSQFWLTANNAQKQLTKLEVNVSYTGNEDRYVVEYSQHNQPVTINTPSL